MPRKVEDATSWGSRVALVWDFAVPLRTLARAIWRKVRGEHRYALAVIGTFYGIPYVWNDKGTNLGAELDGYDCSGFVRDCWRFLTELGFRSPVRPIPNGSANQAAAFKDRRVPLSALRMGDLVFYVNSEGKVIHVMMALGMRDLVIGARGGTSTTKGDKPTAFVDLKRATYWRSAVSHAVRP